MRLTEPALPDLDATVGAVFEHPPQRPELLLEPGDDTGGAGRSEVAGFVGPAQAVEGHVGDLVDDRVDRVLRAGAEPPGGPVAHADDGVGGDLLVDRPVAGGKP